MCMIFQTGTKFTSENSGEVQHQGFQSAIGIAISGAYHSMTPNLFYFCLFLLFYMLVSAPLFVYYKLEFFLETESKKNVEEKGGSYANLPLFNNSNQPGTSRTKANLRFTIAWTFAILFLVPLENSVKDALFQNLKMDYGNLAVHAFDTPFITGFYGVQKT
eukprot:Awhi_evm2s9397